MYRLVHLIICVPMYIPPYTCTALPLFYCNKYHLFYRHDLSYHDLVLTACTLFWFWVGPQRQHWGNEETFTNCTDCIVSWRKNNQTENFKKIVPGWRTIQILQELPCIPDHLLPLTFKHVRKYTCTPQTCTPIHILKKTYTCTPKNLYTCTLKNLYTCPVDNRLTCSGNPLFKSCVEEKAKQREIAVCSRSFFQRPQH